MREIQVIRWCDGEHVDREPAVIEREERLGGTPVLLDLCEPCDEAFEKDLTTVREWLAGGAGEKAQVGALGAAGPGRTRRCRRSAGRDDVSGAGLRACGTDSSGGEPACPKVHGKKFADYPGMVKTPEPADQQ